MPFEIVRNDIVNMCVDAVVNTANPKCIVGTGVDSAIHKKAGAKLIAARKQIGDISFGDAAITSAFGLNAKYVIHAVGPVWQDGKHNEEALLSSCYRKSLSLAKQNKCKSIAFPLISAGNYGFPKAQAMQIAVNEISAFLMDNEMQIYLVVFGKEEFALSEKLFNSVKSYIDENYIKQKAQDEYGDACFSRRYSANMPERVLQDLQMYSVASAPKETDMHNAVMASVDAPQKTDSLTDILNSLDAGFSETLLHLIDLSGKKDSEVYKKANIDRKLFSKIRNNKAYKPSKTTALAFALALQLNLDETKDFIARAGYALSHSSKLDVIVEYFIINKNYNVYELNEVLFTFDQPLIGA